MDKLFRWMMARETTTSEHKGTGWRLDDGVGSVVDSRVHRLLHCVIGRYHFYTSYPNNLVSVECRSPYLGTSACACIPLSLYGYPTQLGPELPLHVMSPRVS